MHQMRISTKSKKKKVKTVKEPEENPKIERNPTKDRAMHEGDNPSFWDEFMKFTFSYSFIHIRIFKHVPKYFATGL